MISREQSYLLRAGRVPTRKKPNLPRKHLLNRLKGTIDDVLRISRVGASWLIVHGMPGIGKSQLVADLLYENPEYALAHFRKILWVTDRNTEPDGLVDVVGDALALLHHPFHNLYEQPTRLQSIGRCIQNELSNYACSSNSRVLIVLDGVFLVETVRFFEEFTVVIERSIRS